MVLSGFPPLTEIYRERVKYKGKLIVQGGNGMKKRTLTLVLVFSLGLTMAACGNSGRENTGTDEYWRSRDKDAAEARLRFKSFFLIVRGKVLEESSGFMWENLFRRATIGNREHSLEKRNGDDWNGNNAA